MYKRLEKPIRRRRRISPIFQMTQTECGAACIAMILTYYHHSITLAECRDFCRPGRDGLTARQLAEAARKFGLEAKGFTLEPDAIGDLPLPAIAHWNFNHFIVVERLTSNYVYVVDPAVGRQRLSRKEFDEGFTGILLTFTPTSSLKVKKHSRPNFWSKYIRYALAGSDVKAVLLQILAVSLLLQLIGLGLPLLTKILVDRILPYNLEFELVALTAALAVMVAVFAVVSLFRAMALIYLRAKLDSRLLSGFIKHILSMPYSFFQRYSSGDLLMRMNSNISLREALANQVLETLLDAGMVVGYLLALFIIEPVYGMLVFGIGAIQVCVVLLSAKHTHTLIQQMLDAQAESQGYQVEMLKGVGLIKASGHENAAVSTWSGYFNKYLAASLNRSRYLAYTTTALGVLSTAAPLLLLSLGAYLVLQTNLSIGTMLALNALALSFLAPLSSLIATGLEFQQLGGEIERMSDVLTQKAEVESEGSLLFQGNIELKNVSFRYGPEESLSSLRSINLRIAAGQKVAIVGQTGSGKSTLVKLLLGLYEPTSGEILLDGISLSSLNVKEIRKQIGVVLQEPMLFGDSIRANISFYEPSMSMEQVTSAARLAAIDDDILAMPMAYETQISEDGSALSGGQRQRISLARALAFKPTVLILDEATSHLDVVTEAEVERNLDTLQSTRIIVAHRLSTIRNADLILVLENGEIVEQGAHSELMEVSGLYAHLVSSQSQAKSPIPLEVKQSDFSSARTEMFL